MDSSSTAPAAVTTSVQQGMMTEDPLPTTIHDLPTPTLVTILQLIPLQQRLTTCTLVTKTWDYAARLATTEINTELSDETWTNSLSPWLKSKGSESLTSLSLGSVSEDTTARRQLARHGQGSAAIAVQSQQLQLGPQQAATAAAPTNAILQALAGPGSSPPSSSSTASVQQKLSINLWHIPLQLHRLILKDCFIDVNFKHSTECKTVHRPTKLTHLAFDTCTFDPVSGLSVLAGLTNLRHLGLTGPTMHSREKLSILSCVLPNLTKLTHLAVGQESCHDEPSYDSDLGHHVPLSYPPSETTLLCDGVSQFSSLTALHILKVGMPVTTAALAGLSALQQLTWLLLEGTHGVNFSSSSSSGSSSSSSTAVNSIPGLTQLTALQKLQLRAAGRLYPQVLFSFKQLQHLEVTNTPLGDTAAVAAASAATTAAFLTAVAKLQQLTHLYWHEQDHHGWAPAAAYAALTANSSLRELYVNMAGAVRGNAPAIFKELFRDGLHSAMNLRTLQLGGYCFTASFDTSHIVTCCPALREVGLVSWKLFGETVPTHRQINALTGLSHLTRLSVYLLTDEASAFSALARLTRLEHLALEILGNAEGHNFSALTTLTRLSQLTWWPVWGKPVQLHSTAAGGKDPNVWWQLQQHIEVNNWPPVTSTAVFSSNAVFLQWRSTLPM